MKHEAQSEAPSVDTLKQVLATLFSDGRSIGHIRAVTAKEWEQIIGSAEAKINRLITGAEENGILKGLYQARYATEPGSGEEQRIDNQIAELSNNLSKGDGDE